MKYNFYIILFLGWYFFLPVKGLLAQTKKEQIETLIFQKDSLVIVLENERQEGGDRIKLMEARNSIQMDSLVKVLIEEQQKGYEKIRQLETKISKAYSEITLTKKELIQAKEELKFLEIELQKRNDSIFALINRVKELEDISIGPNSNLDTIIWEMTDLWGQVEFNLKLLLPAAQFDPPFGRFLISGDRKIRINYDYNNTTWLDAIDSEGVSPLFFKIEDAVEHYSKGLKDLEVTIGEGFFIKGKNDSNELISIKGIYTELASLQGREEGEPTWLWSNTLVLKALVNQKDHVEYKAISDWLNLNFNENSVVYKFDE